MKQHYETLGDIAGMLHAAEYSFESYITDPDSGDFEVGYNVQAMGDKVIVGGIPNRDYLNVVDKRQLSFIDGFDHTICPHVSDAEQHVREERNERQFVEPFVSVESVQANDGIEYFDGVVVAQRIHPDDGVDSPEELSKVLRNVAFASQQLFNSVIEEFGVEIDDESATEPDDGGDAVRGFR